MRNASRAAGGFGLVLALVAFAPGAPPGDPPIVPPPPPRPIEHAPTVPGQDALRPLAEARREAAREQFDEAWTYFREGRYETSLPVYIWSRLLLDSDLDLATTTPARVAAYEAHQARLKPIEALVRRVKLIGRTWSIEVKAVDFYRREAEYWVARERAR